MASGAERGRVTAQTSEELLREARRLERDGSLDEAIQAYLQLLHRKPDLPNSWYNLARLQTRQRQYAEALAAYQQALDRGIERPEEVHLNRGVIFSDALRQFAAAERELQAALALNPAYVPALLNLANLHEDRGARQAAATQYERILSLEPRSAQALSRYANLRNFSDPDDPLIGRLRRALAEPAASPADRASLGFALGRALDACAHYAAAFATYAQANRDSRASAEPGAGRYSRTAEERFIDRIIAAFPGERPSVGRPGVERPSAAARPIFVCGMFRSGSTLTEQLLAGHPQVQAGGELELLPHIAHHLLAPFPEALAAASPGRLQSAAGLYLDSLAKLFPAGQFVTDKRPDNFLYIGLIKRLFPAAKIIHTVREPLDNCLSLFFLHLDQRMSYALDLMDIGHHYRQYRRLMAHWQRLFGPDIFDVCYDTLVQEPKPAMAQLLGFLGLDWNERCLEVPAAGRVIRTASVWEAREPLYTRSSGRARHYARELDQLRAYLAEAG